LRLNKPIHIITLTEYFSFITLTFLSVWFYEERLHADSGWYAFNLINSGSFHIEHGRFILFFSQILPWIAIQFGLSLKSILLAYSLNHIFFPSTIYLICKHIFKHRTTGLLIIALQLISISKGFFCPMFEFYYVAYLLVLFAVILQSDFRYKYFLLPPLLLIICTGHPLAFLLALLVIAYRFIDQGKEVCKSSFAFILLIIIFYFIKSEYTSEYDLAKQNAFYNTLATARYDTAYLLKLGNMLLTYYWGIVIVFVLTGSLLLAQKRAYHLLIFIGSFCLFLVIANISYYGFYITRYQEQVYFPLSFAVAFPLFFYVLPKATALKKNIIFTVFILLLIARFVNLKNESTFFVQRTSEIEQQITTARNLNIQKALVYQESLSYPTNWSYPIESMLISSIAGNKNTVNLATDEDYYYQDNNENLDSTKYILRKWEIMPITQLNSSYFQLDTSQYQELISQ
jgi:hypothetical protein